MDSSRITRIDDLGNGLEELLKLAGVEDLSSLAKQDATSLQTRLTTLNERKKILPKNPGKQDVKDWIKRARKQVDASVEPDKPVSTDTETAGKGDKGAASKDETKNEIDTLLESALEAEIVSPQLRDQWESLLPLPKKASSPPPPPAPPPIIVTPNTPPAPQPGPPAEGGPQPRKKPRQPSPHRIPKKKSADLGSFKNFDDYQHESEDIPLPEDAPDRDYESDAKGKKKRRKGISFHHGVRMYFASVIAILLRIVGISTVISLTIGVLFFPDELVWFMIGPGIYALLGITQLFLIPPLRCRVCGRKLFTPSTTTKNAGAHKYFGLGFVSSLAIHTLIKLWFRCQYCATTQRIKN